MSASTVPDILKFKRDMTLRWPQGRIADVARLQGRLLGIGVVRRQFSVVAASWLLA
jgi:hypothetical protein